MVLDLRWPTWAPGYLPLCHHGGGLVQINTSALGLIHRAANDLGNLVQKKVEDSTGIKLEWEIKLLGLHKDSNFNSGNLKL